MTNERGSTEIESILAVEGGNVATRAFLVDRVEGTYRFVARGECLTTLALPQSSFEIGLWSALQQLEGAAGRILLSASGASQPRGRSLSWGSVIMPEQPDGHGVDALVASTSILPPLRVAIAGLIRDLSVESARRAVESTYTVVEDIIALNEGAQRWGTARGIEAKLEALCQNPPHVILLVGGVDEGAYGRRVYTPLLEIAEMLGAVASVLDKPARPVVIFAGNQSARSAVADLLSDQFEFRAVDNVRPELGLEVLTGVQQELERLYQETIIKQIPHLDALVNLSTAPLMSSARAFELVVRFVARQYNLIRGVLGVDIGGASTQIFVAMGDHSCGLVKGNLGTSHGLESLLDQIAIEDILRWLPFVMPAAEARNRLLNKWVHPLSIPQTREDLLLEQAVAREAMRLALRELRPRWATLAESSALALQGDGLLPPLDLLIARGGVLSHAPNPGQAALMLLDAFQPVGLSRLVLDQLSLLPAIGAMAALQPLAAAEVLERDGFLDLGTVIAPTGQARRGEIILRFRMEYADGSTVQVEVPYGSLEVIPLPLGQTANLELRPARGFDIGMGSKGRGGKTQVQGGALGLIIDARGRPLAFSSRPQVQQARMQEWLWSIGG